MEIILLLLAALIPAALFINSDDGDSTGDTAVTADDTPVTPDIEETTDYSGNDVIISEDHQKVFEENTSLTPEQLALVEFPVGQIVVNTGAGNDLVVGGSENDVIRAGSGNDYVVGGAGDDEIHLGNGDDESLVYQIDYERYGILDEGDDTIFGGRGDDLIVDRYGSNVIYGNQGDDDIGVLDWGEEIEPDTVYGGWGSDVIFADQGDTVTGGPGKDYLVVEVYDLEDDDNEYLAVEITDFNINEDELYLEGPTELFATPETLPGEPPAESPVTVVAFSDGTGATVYVNGIPVANVVGGQALVVSDITFVEESATGLI